VAGWGVGVRKKCYLPLYTGSKIQRIIFKVYYIIQGYFQKNDEKV